MMMSISMMQLIILAVMGQHQQKVDAIQNCPQHCFCSGSSIWSGSIVNCSHANLQTLPDLLSSDVVELYLNHNNITEVEDYAFRTTPQLQKLELHHNSIAVIGQHAFPAEILQQLKILDLSHNHLRHIPVHLPVNIVNLYLSYNEIYSLNYVPFINLNMLEELYLDHNKLTSITAKAFTPNGMDERPSILMSRIHKLALNANLIHTITSAAFASLQSLSRLTLANNKLHNITSHTLEGLNNLKYLDLRNNEINDTEIGAFRTMPKIKFLYLGNNLLTVLPRELPSLEWFDMSSNHIATIDEKIHKEDIYPIDIFVISNNPLNCDCKLLWLKELYDRREHFYHAVKASYDLIPTCASPEIVAQEPWDLLGDDMFMCETTEDTASVVNSVVKSANLNPEDIYLATDTSQKNYKDFMVSDVTDASALLTWRSKQYLKSDVLRVQYYIFGNRKTMKTVDVLTQDQSYVLNGLVAGSSYLVCIIPLDAGDKPEVSLDQCIEFSTNSDFIINWSAVAMFLAYSFVWLVKLLVAIIIACVIVGIVAVAISAWNCTQERGVQPEALLSRNDSCTSSTSSLPSKGLDTDNKCKTL